MKKILFIISIFPFFAFAQDDLLAGMDSIPKNQKVESAFKGLKIVNIESTKLASKGDLYLIVAHRFGSVKDGFEGFFGLDQANTQIKFLYGLNKWLTISGARSEVAYDFSVKYSLQPQIKDGFPIAIVAFNSVAINNTLKEHNLPKLEFSDRLTYVAQLLISRKFSNKFSFELAPTFFHENFVANDFQNNNQYAIGFGGRYKIASRWSINMDYAAHLNRTSTSTYKNPLSIGVDLETGGHVFQMHFTSSQSIHEAGYLGQTTGDWTKGNVFFGFNLVRVF
jgi:Membrane bound beta barrel domain (DUF5777)